MRAYVFVYVLCAQMCSAVRAAYKSGVGDHAGVRGAATSGATNFAGWLLQMLSGAEASCGQTQKARKPHDHSQLLLFYGYSKIISTSIHIQLVFLWTHL